MTPGQQLLTELLVSNELLNEKQCAKVFQQVPEPEAALARLVKAGHLTDRVGTQLLEMYKVKAAALEKDKPKEAEGNGAAPAAPAKAEPKTEAKPEAKADGKKAAAAHDAETPASSATAGAATSTKAVAADKAEKAEKTEKAPATPKSTSTKPFIPDSKGKELLHGILQKARELGASDVHITAGLAPVMRLSSKLVEMEMPPLSPETTRSALLSLLDPERRAHVEEHHDLDFCYDGGEALGRFRANILVEQNGTDGVFRLISPKVPSLQELGMPELVAKFTTYAVGIVLITGPKSCGKTTTLAAMIDLINRTRADHIVTIEDPIEFVHPCKKGHISQREVGTHTKTFGAALRAALREAPQVIMVGEMRDLETTSLAISAAETGHLVLATLHTPDAIRTIGRVLDVFPPKEQSQIRAMLSESLRGVVSQQLVPGKDGKTMHLALEILVNTSAIGNLIREERSFQIRGSMQTGRRLGMVLLDDSLLKLVQDGKIEPQEAVQRASDSDYVMKELSRMATK
jgi:twitching motility protein PilT